MQRKTQCNTLLLLLATACTGIAASDPAVFFHIPFDTAKYDGGPLVALSDDELTGALVYWRTDENSVYLGLAANAPYVGFGMNDGPGMPGADIVLCREVADGVVSAADYHSLRYGLPELDVVQDWQTIAAGRHHTPPPVMPEGACTEGWSWSGSACFRVFEDERSWDSAKSRCEGLGAQLAKISSDYENKLVRSLASDGNIKLWLGAASNGQSQHAWSDGSALTFSSWQVGEGDAAGECTFMGYLNHKDDKWYDTDCRWAEVRYACSMPAAAGTPTMTPEQMRPEEPVTWCEVSRSRSTCEVREDMQLGDLDLSLYGLLAWAPATATTLKYHGVSQRRVIPFSFLQPSSVPLPGDVATLTLTAPNHIVAVTGGSYACSYHVLSLPDPDTKYHIINYKINIGGPSVDAGVFHHMDMNACDGAVPGMADGQTAPCEALMGLCQSVLMNGGYGPSGVDLPQDAGIPIGKGATAHVVLSRHFYNPALKSGVLDTGSSYTLTYTPTLRTNDLSQITLGTTQLVVPPNSFGFVVSSHCSSSCSERLGNVQVRSVSFHLHGHGARSSVRLVRDGQELEPLATIDPWDQAWATKTVNREVRPGDTLILDCVYDNDLDQEITYGDEISQEMCFAFMTVFGRSSVRSCLDFPQGLEGTPPPSCDGWTHLDVCNFNLPRSYCPNTNDPSASTVFITETERNAPFTPFILTPRDTSCEGGMGTPVSVPAVPGKCETESIAGLHDCAMGDDVDFRISWTTDCVTQTVVFELSARSQGGSGWFALGLHDAGTATSPVELTPTRMMNADIIQVSVASGSMRDGISEDYTAPREKNPPAATLVSHANAKGRWEATVSRPFASDEGVTLAEDRFLWLMCAIRSGTNDLDAKHHRAHAVASTRVSLFGGVAESTRYVPGGNESTSPSPTPVSPTPAPDAGDNEDACEDNVTGPQSCGSSNFTISWTVNCTQREVLFELRAPGTGAGWLAMGLHDAGTAEAEVALPTAVMTGADVVQVSVDAGGVLRDGMAVGYQAPKAKSTPTTSLVSAEDSGGWWQASFTRPFAVAEGLGFTSRSFVWLLCAANEESNDLDAQHQWAAIAGRVAIFGDLALSPSPASDSTSPLPVPTPATTPVPSDEMLLAAQVRMVIEGLSFPQLTENKPLLDAFIEAVIAACVATFEHVTADMVKLLLSQGSIKVQATILPRSNGDGVAVGVASTLAAGTSRTAFQELVAERVAAVPNIASVATGSFVVSGVSVTLEEVDPNDYIQSGVDSHCTDGGPQWWSMVALLVAALRF